VDDLPCALPLESIQTAEGGWAASKEFPYDVTREVINR
jgi:hypothetical protein